MLILIQRAVSSLEMLHLCKTQLTAQHNPFAPCNPTLGVRMWDVVVIILLTTQLCRLLPLWDPDICLSPHPRTAPLSLSHTPMVAPHPSPFSPTQAHMYHPHAWTIPSLPMPYVVPCMVGQHLPCLLDLSGHMEDQQQSMLA